MCLAGLGWLRAVGDREELYGYQITSGRSGCFAGAGVCILRKLCNVDRLVVQIKGSSK